MQEGGLNGDGTKPAGYVLKPVQLKSADDVAALRSEFAEGRTVMILGVAPLATKGSDEVKRAVEELYELATSTGGDIARLGDERVVITPPGVRIWREE